MRQDEQQVSNDHPEAVRSTPVPVPPADDRTSRSDVPEDALDERGTFDEQTTDPDRTNGTERDAAYDPVDDERADDADPRQRRDDRSTDEGGFHEPGPLPTTFGATTVADAVAASALASPRPQDQPDPGPSGLPSRATAPRTVSVRACAPTPPQNCTAATLMSTSTTTRTSTTAPTRTPPRGPSWRRGARTAPPSGATT
ncbi:hypothetical protein ACQP08_26910 [Micromonospora zamorensis]|uniref:hypothetical protein n=1 Tax=Micromonospora zamorensis TaxID=709883 RepID=UPI003D8CE385